MDTMSINYQPDAILILILFDKCENLTDSKEYTGNFIVSDLHVGHHYFACGVGDGYHCKHGVKAHIQVVLDKNQCTFSAH